MSPLYLDLLFVGAIGAIVGLAEIAQRHPNDPTSAVTTVSGLSYAALNAAFAAGALAVLRVLGWTPEGRTDATVRLLQVFTAGFGSVIIFRSPLMTTGLYQGVGKYGPARVMQIFLDLSEKGVKRELHRRILKRVSRIMKDVSFERAYEALPKRCAGYGDFKSEVSVEQTIENVLTLMDSKQSDRTKAVELGAWLASLVGVRVLRDAVRSLGDEILDPKIRQAQPAQEDQKPQRVESVHGLDEEGREFARALEEGELRVYYQPEVTVRDAEIIGVEALLRWQHPVEGLMTPSRFLEAAERSGLIIDAGIWLLEEAVRQLQSWKLTLRGSTQPRLWVNVSAPELRDSDLGTRMLRTLKKQDFPPALLGVDVTRRAMILADRKGLANLEQLRMAGVSVAIDDFGADPIVLDELRRLRLVNTVKLSSAVVGRIGNDRDESSMKALINIAYGHNWSSVAKGVEQPRQYLALRGTKCSSAQGFLFQSPADEGVLISIVRRGRIDF